MFQYVLYYQLRQIDKRVYIDRSRVGYRSYRLNKWDASLKDFNPLLASFINNNDKYIWNRMYIYYLGYKNNNITFLATGKDSFSYLADYKNKHIYYEGYWQNLEYFKGIEEEIKKTFSINKITFSPRNVKWKNQIDTTESVAIHVRAGDYIKQKDLYGGICGSQYYKRAIKHIEENIVQPVYYVFSNDLRYARSILPEKEYIFVEGNTEDDAIEEMMLMRSCKHQIIANSTFSWWAAWLNDYPKKHVVMPGTWMNGYGPVNLAENGWKVL